MNFNKQSLFVGALIGFCFFSASVHAHDDTLVLPKGIFRTWAVWANGGVSEKFNQDNKLVGLAHNLNRSVSISQQAAGNEDLNKLYQALNDFEPGLGDSLGYTEIRTRAKTDFNQFVVAQEYGLTSKLSLGVIIPFRNIKTTGSFEAYGTSNVDAVSEKVRGTELAPKVAAYKKAAPVGSEATSLYQQKIFLERGYEVPTDTTASGLDDIEVGGKYQIFNVNDIFRGATKFGVRLPTTSHRARQSQIFDQSTGDGQIDLAAQYIMEYAPFRMWTIAGSVMGTVQLPNKEDRFINTYGETGLPDLNNPALRDRITRNLGDKVETQLATNVKLFNQRIGAEFAYNFMAKTKDKYSGDRVDLDYGSISNGTSAYAHSIETAISFSTLTDFRAKRFFMPLDIALAYNNVLYGKNVNDASYFKLTLKAYY